MTLLAYIPHSQAAAYERAGWTVSRLAGNHAAYSVLGVLLDPQWRDMVRPAKRRTWHGR